MKVSHRTSKRIWMATLTIASALYGTALLSSPSISTTLADTANESSAVAAPNDLAAASTFSVKVPVPTPPQVQAQAVVLMDADNGQILYERSATERREPASTTKIMTMLLTMEAVAQRKAAWSDIVPVTPDAQKVAMEPGVSDAYLDPSEQFTLSDMMKFISVLSANDATIAVADKIGGNQSAFVSMMNEEAHRLGLSGTHYMNPDGLPAANHYTTALDLAKLSRYLVTNYPQVLNYTKLQQVTVRKGNTWPNTDELLGHYQGLDGLKTGFTDAAGYCYVGTAQHSGIRLIAVVMGDTTVNQRFIDAAALLDYGFTQFQEQSLLKANNPLSQTFSVPNGKQTKLAATTATGLVLDLPSGLQGDIVIQPNPSLTAPIKQGAVIGKASYVVNGNTISTVPIVAAEDDGKANFVTMFFRGVGHWISHLLHR